MEKDITTIIETIKRKGKEGREKIIKEGEKKIKEIIEEGRKQGEKERERLIEEMKKEMEQIREKYKTSIRFEKKRAILEERGKFIDEIFEKLEKYGKNFRNNKNYRSFLKKSIIEGIKTIGTKNIIIYYSKYDKEIFNPEFIEEIKKEIGERIEIELKQEDFEEPGVIISSYDKKVLYDDTFKARIKRKYEEIYKEIVKEVF